MKQFDFIKAAAQNEKAKIMKRDKHVHQCNSLFRYMIYQNKQKYKAFKNTYQHSVFPRYSKILSLIEERRTKEQKYKTWHKLQSWTGNYLEDHVAFGNHFQVTPLMKQTWVYMLLSLFFFSFFFWLKLHFILLISEI